MNIAVKPAAKHAAPGPYLGFGLQPVRFCYHLLKCPAGATVSLEYLDDVAIHKADQSTVLEQTKSALKQNPLTDWSVDLWKAIANWLDAGDTKKVDPAHTEYRLYVTPIHSGDWATAIHNAQTDADVAAIVQEITTKYAKLKKAPGCTAHIEKFLNAPENVRATLVKKITIESSSNDPVDALRELVQHTVAPEMVDIICGAAIGIAKTRAEALIRDGKLALLDGDSFKSFFIDFVKKNNLPGLLVSLTSEPSKHDVEALLAARPTFIRQLEIIDTKTEERVRAVSDYMRTSADKTAWADSGQIFAEGLYEWDNGLLRQHSFITGEITDVYAGKDAAFMGRMSYRRCAQLQPTMDGRAVPGHFVHGCFNSLAEDMHLGWHPDYKDILGGES